jgi:hypothetical protein
MQLIFYYKKFEFRNNSIDSNQKFTSENNFDEQFTSFDLMDFLPDTSSSVESIQYQTNEQINKKQESVRKFSSPYDILIMKLYSSNFHLELLNNEFNPYIYEEY